MRANLKTILGLAALGLTLVATTGPTWAGRVSTDRVTIGSNQVASWASGNLVDARDSADTRQQIGCRAQALSPVYPFTTCHAMDSAGRSLTCGSGDPKFQEVVQGMTDSSFVYFQTGSNGSTGTCTHIMIYDGSDLLK